MISKFSLSRDYKKSTEATKISLAHQEKAKSQIASSSAIEVHELTRCFGSFVAVNRINFSIRSGEVVAFLGPNGAGKTTTIKMLTGLLRPTSGQAFILGFDVEKNLPQIKNFIGYMSQRFSLYPLLTAAENIEFFGGIVGLRRQKIKEKIEELAAIISSDYLNQPTQTLPPGIRQEVALFAALLHDPPIIFLDEPTSGVSPERRRHFWMKIYDLKCQGKTLLVSTHNLDEAEYADRIIIIHQGKIRFQGELASLYEQEKVTSLENFFKQMVSEPKNGSNNSSY
ncbi:MAG: ABC transporter ATP-binding protein [Candidatus Aminicenantes bacterium]|nr:ABC transporter ATP-binding protein [Candidatus Aminicenantes bacterium]